MNKEKQTQLKKSLLILRIQQLVNQEQASGEPFINGLKVKAISGMDSSKLKYKQKDLTIKIKKLWQMLRLNSVQLNRLKNNKR
jgi:hypothetical protein